MTLTDSDMINSDLFKLFITVLIAVVGWIIGHYFNTTLKRREIITTHLINAYRVLANDITHREANPERDLKLETVIAELQLFGSEKQITLTKKLAEDVKRGGTFYVDDLLNDLRNDLRTELELSPLEGNVKWLRCNNTNLAAK